jgi:hypothetical protein
MQQENSKNCNDILFCFNEFKRRVEKLIKKNSYQNIKSAIIDAIHNKSMEHFRKGKRIRTMGAYTLQKLRADGSGGYRFYSFIISSPEKIFLAIVHPKFGSQAVENIGTAHETELINAAIRGISNNDFYKIALTSESIDFIHISELGSLKV